MPFIEDQDMIWHSRRNVPIRRAGMHRPSMGLIHINDCTSRAGLTLIHEAEHSQTITKLAQATQVRNGLMVAMLGFHPIRRKNFAALEIGRSLVRICGRWWIVLSAAETKENRADERRGDHAPIKSGISAQLAVAIAILTFAPIRLGNLIRIELDQNLIKPGGLNTPYWLVFPNYDVKNKVDLNFQFDQPLTHLIDEYIHDFRPALLRGTNTPLLFPGEFGQPKHRLQFSKQITVRIQKAIGLRITVHQFRHAAAAIYLKHRPGDYETVRRFLGHRNINTTVQFYCWLQTLEATQQFGKLIREQIKFDADH